MLYVIKLFCRYASTLLPLVASTLNKHNGSTVPVAGQRLHATRRLYINKRAICALHGIAGHARHSRNLHGYTRTRRHICVLEEFMTQLTHRTRNTRTLSSV